MLVVEFSSLFPGIAHFWGLVVWGVQNLVQQIASFSLPAGVNVALGKISFHQRVRWSYLEPLLVLLYSSLVAAAHKAGELKVHSAQDQVGAPILVGRVYANHR